jgi:hypothetical protein
MFSVKVETSDGKIKNFTAKSFYQVVMGQGKLKVRWETLEGEELVTYARIKAIVEKKVSL